MVAKKKAVHSGSKTAKSSSAKVSTKKVVHLVSKPAKLQKIKFEPEIRVYSTPETLVQETAHLIKVSINKNAELRFALLPGLAEIVDLANIATGGKRLAAGAGHDHPRYRRIVAPAIELGAQRPHHCQRHGIEGLRAIERHDPG